MKTDEPGRLSRRAARFRFLPWFAVWTLFMVFASWLRSVLPWSDCDGTGLSEWIGHEVDYGVYGMDYIPYSEWFRRMLAPIGIRHPLFNVLISPFSAFLICVRKLGMEPFWICLTGIFSAVMTGAVYLVGRIMRRVGLSAAESVSCMALFMSFSYTWLLAACPESFGISCLLSLGLLLWGLRDAGRRMDMVGWGVMAFLMGGVTSPQALKAVLAYVATHRLTKRLLLALFAFCTCFLGVAGGLFGYRIYLKCSSGLGFGDAVMNSWGSCIRWFGTSDVSVADHVHRWWVFFSEPLVLRGEDVLTSVLGGYSDCLAPSVAGCVLGCAAVGALLHRRHALVKMIVAMFAVDFVLHFVLFWGMAEAQIYAGHWFYVTPLLAGCVLMHLQGRLRVAYAAFLGFLSAAAFVCNVQAFIRAFA